MSSALSIFNGRKLVNKFALTVASALALGMAGGGFAQAAETSNTTAMPPSNSSASSTNMKQTQTAPLNLSENQIKQVQEQLKTAGFYKGEADGKMGPETKQALQQFQQQNGLQANGELDQQTMAALQSNQGSSGSSNGSLPNNGRGSNDLNTNSR